MSASYDRENDLHGPLKQKRVFLDSNFRSKGKRDVNHTILVIASGIDILEKLLFHN